MSKNTRHFSKIANLRKWRQTEIKNKKTDFILLCLSFREIAWKRLYMTDILSNRWQIQGRGPASPPPTPKGRKNVLETAPRLLHMKVWIPHCKLRLKVSIYWDTLNHSFLADKPIFLSDRFFLKQQKQTLRDSWGHAPFSSKSLKKNYKKKNVKFLSYLIDISKESSKPVTFAHIMYERIFLQT